MADVVREQAGAASGAGRAAPRRVAVVFNPATGGGESADRRRDTEEALAGAGLDVLWLETSRQDPARESPARPSPRASTWSWPRAATARWRRA